MLIFHTAEGRIEHIVFDPVPKGYDTSGKPCVRKDPIPWPEEPVLDKAGVARTKPDGSPMMASRGADRFRVDLAQDYVVDGDVRPRPECPAKIQIDGRTLMLVDVPDESEVVLEVDGVSTAIDERSVEFDEPGPVKIIVKAPWPILEKTYDVEIQ